MSHQIERICLSVNSVCNLACTYCYFFAIPEALPGPEALSEDEIFTVLARAEDYARRPAVHKKIKINFVGSGEPLLSWPAIRGAIQRLQREAPDHRLRFYTVTNAILLTRQIADEMKALGLTPSVSLDGPPELHDRYRVKRGGQGTYQQVLRGIELLREAAEIATSAVADRALAKSILERLAKSLAGEPSCFHRACAVEHPQHQRSARHPVQETVHNDSHLGSLQPAHSDRLTSKVTWLLPELAKVRSAFPSPGPWGAGRPSLVRRPHRGARGSSPRVTSDPANDA